MSTSGPASAGTRGPAPQDKSTPAIMVPHPLVIKRHLDGFVMGQDDAKGALAVAARNHYALLDSDNLTPHGVVVDKFSRFNALVMGPTGSGKTLLLDTLAREIQVPFAIVDVTKMTESGYIGEKVENALQTLWISAGFDLELAQRGIVYFDEFDKLARKSGGGGVRDVSGEGVQKGLLSLLGGAKIRVPTKGTGAPKPEIEFIEFDTTKVLFICGGAFVGLERIIERRLNGQGSIGFGATLATREQDQKKAYELLLQVEDEDLENFGIMPELIGRLPIRTAVMPLSVEQLRRILTDPRNSLVDQYEVLLKEVDLSFTEAALQQIAQEAYEGTTGARALERIMSETLRATNLLLPKRMVIDVEDVKLRRQKLAEALRSQATPVDAPLPPEITSDGPKLVVFYQNQGAKAAVATKLDLPQAAWQIWSRGNDSDYLRLMMNDRGQKYYVLRRHNLQGACPHCSTKSREMICEWTVPYQRGVNPQKALGNVNIHWVCPNENCGELCAGTLDHSQGQFEWSPKD